MNEQELALHYVCTRDEARKLVEQHEKFWVLNCGCREEGPGCARSRIDVCLCFKKYEGSGLKKVTREFVDGIFAEAENKKLITRPFRDSDDMSKTAGVCFCCDDCCGYFKNPEEVCDKGRFIQQTDMETCTHCGVCEETCYFGARRMINGKLAIDQEGCYGCYGCGLCLDMCPEDCIEMVPRT